MASLVVPTLLDFARMPVADILAEPLVTHRVPREIIHERVPELLRGIADTNYAQVLPRQIGPARARDMLLTGRRISALHARAWNPDAIALPIGGFYKYRKGGETHAFDTKTGKILWEKQLDYPALTVPITYQGKDGRQYVAVLASGSSLAPSSRTEEGRPANNESLIAFALPE